MVQPKGFTPYPAQFSVTSNTQAEPQSAPKCLGWPTAHRTAEVGDKVLKSPGPTTMPARKAIRDFLAESYRGTVRLNTAEPLH